jgi:thiamine biosynthesis lipoprotein
VAPELFRLLQRIQRLSEITDGAFDITVGPLLDIWGFRGTVSERPDDEKIRKTLAMVGMSRLELNRPQRTVLFRTEGMKLDLGGIGKGYALDIAADILQSAGVDSALLHGGTSSVRVLGVDPSGKPWRIAIGVPHASSTDDTLGSVSLVDESMSVSAPSGRMVDLDAGTFGHVIDPRIGQPVREADLAVCVAPTATDSDALATGLMVLGRTGIPQLGRHVVGFRGAVVIDGEVIQSTETIETDLTEAP